MALTKGPGGMGHVVWLATRTVRSACKTWPVLGHLVGPMEGEPLGGSVLSLVSKHVPTRERQGTPTATG